MIGFIYVKDKETFNQLQSIDHKDIYFIESSKELFTHNTLFKFMTIVNDLITESSDSALSAKQGAVLNQLIQDNIIHYEERISDAGGSATRKSLSKKDGKFISLA